MFSLQEIEYLHNSGKMPDRYYYQQNGKSADQNYSEWKQKVYNKITAINAETQIEETITQSLQEILDRLINRL